MHKKYKTISIFSLVVMFILLCSFVFLPFLKTSKTVYAEGDNSLYAFVSKQEGKVINGKIYVDIGLSLDYTIKDKDDSNKVTNKAGEVNRLDAEAMVENKIVPFESAKIYFRTRNMSAISEEGDYEAVDQSFTVLGTSPCISLAVKVNNTGLQVGDNARQFYVEIYKVEITGLKEGYTFKQPHTTKEISSKTLSTGAEITIGQKKSTYVNGEYLYNLDLGYQEYNIPQSTCRDVTTNTSFNDIKINLANYSNGWYNKVKYLSDHDMAKLGMRVAVAAYEEANGAYTDNSFVGVQIFGGDSKNVGAPALEEVPDKNVFTDDSVVELARWYAKFQSDERESLDISEAFNGKFEGVTVNTILNENVLIPGSIATKNYGQGGKYDPYVGSMSSRDNIFLINDLNAALNGSTTISTRFWSYLSGKVKYYSGSLLFLPTNYRAHVEKATLGQVYKDENGKEKVGVSLRFSEPVQFKKNKNNEYAVPYMTGYINGNSANALKFDYVSGAGTDTLFFEADMSQHKMHATRIAIRTAHNFESIYDFAPNAPGGGWSGPSQHLNVMDKEQTGLVNGWDNIYTQTLLCSYDLRTPNISMDGDAPRTEKTSHAVTIRTGNIGETGKLYYAWRTDNTKVNIKDYSNIPQDFFSVPIAPQGFQTISSPANISGVRYLHAFAVSELGKIGEMEPEGPFYFDNDKPTLKVELSEDEYKQKTFNVTISNKSSTIENFTKYAALKNELKLYVASDAKGEDIIKDFSIRVPDDKLATESVAVEYTLTAAELGLQANEKEYGDYYIFFAISDALENKGTTEPISCYFDVREIFSVTLIKNNFEMDEFAPGKLSLDENYYTIDLSKIGDGKTLAFRTEEESISSMEVEEFIRVETEENVVSKLDYSSQNKEINIRITESFNPGLYRLRLKCSNKKSLPIYFYVTEGRVGEDARYGEETGGYQAISNNLVLNNKVFQIPTSTSYYYMTDKGLVVKEGYIDGSRPLVFSSRDMAYSYILYREYLDLYAVVLTSTLAEDLNRGSVSIHHKATGETREAAEGQVWIRYKETNWRPDSTTSDWVYYYYGEDASSLPINLGALSNELQVAMNTVASMICESGKELNLVTNEYLDKHGAPTLRPEQMHLQALSSDTSINGTQFENPARYLGDTGMNVVLDAEAPLATNAILPFGEYRRFYYKINQDTYIPLTNENYETLGEYFNVASGKVPILELDENGVREYFVYIDKVAPKLNLSWMTKTDTITETEYDVLSAEDDGRTITGNNFCIENLDDYDTLAFVAIYRYTSQSEGELLNVYRKSDFDKGPVHLEDGKYHVHVSDRLGNSYIFVLQVKSTPLVVTVKEVENSYITVDFNRTKEEVRYQVYLDGWLFTTNYEDKRFTESGEYRFVVEDIYGNVEEKILLFERDLPVVDWRYQNSNGAYVAYDFEKENERITIKKVDDQNYIISTSTYLRFMPLDGCTYEIISGNPSPSKNIGSGWVTLNNKVPFTMKVYYESYPETYVMYTCVIDDSSPQIRVSYEKEYYQAFEIEEIKNKFQEALKNNFENEDGFKVGDNPFKPTLIGYSADKSQSATLYVTEGQQVQSKYFKVQVSDDSDVKKVEVYCDGELLDTITSNFSNIYISQRGAYKIVATDAFGNMATFSFVNEYQERVEYFVDGEKMSTDVAFADMFDNGVYTKVEYGNSQTELKILSDVEIHYLITAGEKTYHFAFVVEDGKIYVFEYEIKISQIEIRDEEGKVVEVQREIENISIRKDELTSGVIAEIKDIGVAISLSKYKDGTILLKVHSTDDTEKTYTVETRVSSLDNQNEMPYYFKTEISTSPSTVGFIVDEVNKDVAISQTIKGNSSFEVVVDDATAKNIESVQVAFSETGNYTNYEVVTNGATFTQKGMYHVKVVNKYGIQTDYYVILSSQFVMSAKVEHADGATIEYSIEYCTKEQDTFYSNKSVEFIVYSSNPQVITTGTGGKISETASEQGNTIIYIDKPGTYHLTIVDEYGNKLEKTVFIESKTLEISQDVLTNFNEKALRRDENYTNQEILINKNAVNASKIAYIAMMYGDKTIIIYDDISEEKTAFDENQSIGALGDGEYTIIFKDRYGNRTAKDTKIHYCGTPTLTIKRTTLNSVEAEIYPLEDMLAHGVWTNNSVTFSVSATKYTLTVDEKENVKSITYDARTKNEYDVYYKDEYGFEYAFKVYLHREEVVITPAESMSLTQISDMLVTKDNVAVSFSENATCKYTLNNEAEKDYNVGDILYKDGVYRFKAVDKAGNISTYTLKKDSAVEYRLEGAGVDEILLNGGVTNGRSVKFFSENKDNAYIKKVFHNNEFIEYEGETFTERGKWELIVADDVGNESYFRFYILYGKIDGFTYNTPYGYKIESVVWEMEDSIANATETIKEQGLRLEATENGTYTVTMKCRGDIKTFTFTIDKTPPQVELDGCQPNEKTINNVSLKGCTVGDTIYVYRDGELVQTARIESDYMKAPTISEAGKYKIVVENEAGVQTELSFERKYVPNVAGSVLIIVLSLAAVIGLFVGLIWRNHSKTDD